MTFPIYPEFVSLLLTADFFFKDSQGLALYSEFLTKGG